MKSYALITGASKGIGLELAKLFAKDGYPLILIARSSHLLEEIKKEFEIKYQIVVKVIVQDLSKSGASKEIYDAIQKEHLQVDYLINNAGFGDYGPFLDSDITKYAQMMHLNTITLMELCYYFGNDMRQRKFGKIMNLGSIASFFPGPLMATYYATKAFVLSFSEALAKELQHSGVSVTALCPGTTATQFFDNAHATVDKTNLLKHMRPAHPSDVAKYGYKKMMKSKTIAIYGAQNKIAIWMNRFIPRKLSRHLVYKIQNRRKDQ